VIDVDRERGAAISTWYELFPRSAGHTPGQHGTFCGCRKPCLPEISTMGFDVLYLPPIHPIGITERKGPEQSSEGGGQRSGQPLGDRRRIGRSQVGFNPEFRGLSRNFRPSQSVKRGPSAASR